MIVAMLVAVLAVALAAAGWAVLHLWAATVDRMTARRRLGLS
jgi:hypothetical protein